MQSLNEFWKFGKPKIKPKEPSQQINLLKTRSKPEVEPEVEPDIKPEKRYFSSTTRKIVLPTALGASAAGGIATYGKDLTPDPKPDVSSDEWKNHSEAWKKNIEDRKRQQQEEALRKTSDEAQFRVNNSESKLSDKSYARDLYRTNTEKSSSQPETPKEEPSFLKKLDKEYGDYLPVVGLGTAVGLGGLALARKLKNRKKSENV